MDSLCSNDKQKQPNSFVHSNTALYREEDVRTACFVYLFIYLFVLSYISHHRLSQIFSTAFCFCSHIRLTLFLRALVEIVVLCYTIHTHLH